MVCLFHISYLITLMAYLWTQRTPNIQIKYFMFDWSFYRLFALNTCRKRDSFQMMIFVNICSKWSMVQLKTWFEAWLTRNDVNGVSSFHLLFKDTYSLPMLTMDTIVPNQVFYVWLVDLQSTWTKLGLDPWLNPKNWYSNIFARHEA
jgi:hypothetical protein